VSEFVGDTLALNPDSGVKSQVGTSTKGAFALLFSTSAPSRERGDPDTF